MNSNSSVRNRALIFFVDMGLSGEGSDVDMIHPKLDDEDDVGIDPEEDEDEDEPEPEPEEVSLTLSPGRTHGLAAHTTSL